MKVCIVGCGHFGSILAYSLVTKDYIGEIVLVDKDINKATRVANDLNQASPILGATFVNAGGFENCIDADIIVIGAGTRRTEGDSRLELAPANAPTVQDIIETIVQYNTRAILLVATNPVDIMTYVALKVSGFDATKVIGLGTLIDTIRMKYFIASKIRVNPLDINLIVIGEHGDNMVPLFSTANVSGLPFNQGMGFDELVKKEVLEKTRKAGEQIISLGGSPAYAPAISATLIIENIALNKKHILPVSLFVDNVYDMDNVCFSLPARISSEGVEEIIVPDLQDSELSRLHRAYEVISSEIERLYRPG